MLERASPELAELIVSVSSGDKQAFKMLYEHTSAKLFGVVLRIVRSRELAEEVVQDVYLRVWRNAGSYAPAAGRPMTWMIAIARHAAIDMIRNRTASRMIAVENSEDRLEQMAGHDDPERDTMIQEQLLRCLGQLGAPQREAVLLAYCSGYSREELATHFESTVPTVKTWLHRALLVLRSCLEAL